MENYKSKLEEVSNFIKEIGESCNRILKTLEKDEVGITASVKEDIDNIVIPFSILDNTDYPCAIEMIIPGIGSRYVLISRLPNIGSKYQFQIMILYSKDFKLDFINVISTESLEFYDIIQAILSCYANLKDIGYMENQKIIIGTVSIGCVIEGIRYSKIPELELVDLGRYSIDNSHIGYISIASIAHDISIEELVVGVPIIQVIISISLRIDGDWDYYLENKKTSNCYFEGVYDGPCDIDVVLKEVIRDIMNIKDVEITDTTPLKLIECKRYDYDKINIPEESDEEKLDDENDNKNKHNLVVGDNLRIFDISIEYKKCKIIKFLVSIVLVNDNWYGFISKYKLDEFTMDDVIVSPCFIGTNNCDLELLINIFINLNQDRLMSEINNEKVNLVKPLNYISSDYDTKIVLDTDYDFVIQVFEKACII